MITHKMPEGDYNAINALRATVLKELVKSPLHAKYALENIKKPSEALIFGRWLHSYLLEKSEFDKTHHFIGRKLDLRTTKDKEYKATLLEEYGENIIDLDSETKLKDMRSSALANPAVAKVLKAITDTELTLQWTEQRVECKARLDAYSKQLKAIIDVKTCQDASPEGFSRSINNYNYHLQASHYLEGAKKCGLEVDSFIFIALEKEAPYASAVYMLEIGTLGTAQSQREDLIKLYRDCQAKDFWPSYSNKILDIALPEWASNQIERNFIKENNYE